MCADLGLSAAKVRVIPPTRHEVIPGRTVPFGQGSLRILYVGSSANYKNLGVVFAVARRCSERTKPWQFALTVDTLPQADTVRQTVICAGKKSRGQLDALYAEADVLVAPSLAETVGLPLLEAMSHGLPIVVADRPYARHICGDAAMFFDPLSADSLYTALERLESRDARSALSQRGLDRLSLFPAAAEAGLRWLDAVAEATRLHMQEAAG